MASYPSTIDAPDTTMQGGSFVAINDHALDHRTIGSAIVAIENKLGLGAGSAGANQILVGSGSGTAQWGTVWNNPTLGTPSITGGTIIGALGSFSGGTFNNSVIGTPTLVLGSDAQGDIFYRSSGGTLTRLSPGTSGQVLQTNGPSANPSWVTPATGGTSGQLQLGTSITTIGTSSTGGTVYIDSMSLSFTTSGTTNIFMLITADWYNNSTNTNYGAIVLDGTIQGNDPILQYDVLTANKAITMTGQFFLNNLAPATHTLKFQIKNVGTGTVAINSGVLSIQAFNK